MSDYKVSDDPEMQAMFEKAIKEGLWFYLSYDGMWFSPQELKEVQKEGWFRWGPVNWELRDPQEYIGHLERSVSVAQGALDAAKGRVAKESELTLREQYDPSNRFPELSWPDDGGSQ